MHARCICFSGFSETHACHRYPHLTDFKPPTEIPYVPLALEYYADDFTQRHNSIGHITLRPVNLPTALRELLRQVHTMTVYEDGTCVIQFVLIDRVRVYLNIDLS